VDDDVTLIDTIMNATRSYVITHPYVNNLCQYRGDWTLDDDDGDGRLITDDMDEVLYGQSGEGWIACLYFGYNALFIYMNRNRI
jgi:hypothetical protein